jgi:hypothetical protein
VKLNCPQCGAEVAVQEVAGVLGCPFCKSSLTLDLDGARLHYAYRPRQEVSALNGLLRRWSRQAGLPPASVRSRPRLVYRPFWRYTPRGSPRLVPAWPTVDPRWQAPQHPEGEQVLFDPEALRGAEIVEATLVEGAARERAMAGMEDGSAAGSLVHVPFYDTDVRIGTGLVQVSVDACSGHVYPQRMPPGSPGAARTGPQSMWLAAVAVLIMVAEAAAIRSPWLAGLAVAVMAALSAWMLRAGPGPGRQAGG